MRRLFSKKALSLLELIIASVLVLIVIMGIFAINNVLSNNNQDYGQRYLVKSETQTTLNHILNNASEAVGSGTTSKISSLEDVGILIGSDMGDVNSFCIHQDIAPPPYSGGTTIDNALVNNPPSAAPDYTNSRWLCYTWYPSGATCPSSNPNCTYQILYCAMPYADQPPYRGASNCNGSGADFAGPQYLGTAFSNPAVTFSATAGGQMAFSITIQNCLTNAASSCFNSDPTKLDPANNPEVTISGSVFPSQEGMQQN